MRVVHQLPTEDVETSRTMGHQGLSLVGVLNTSNHGARLSIVDNEFAKIN